MAKVDRCACACLPNGIIATFMAQFFLFASGFLLMGSMIDCQFVTVPKWQLDIPEPRQAVWWPGQQDVGFGFFFWEGNNGECQYDWLDNVDDNYWDDIWDGYFGFLGHEWQAPRILGSIAIVTWVFLCIGIFFECCVAFIRPLRVILGVLIFLLVTGLHSMTFLVFGSNFCNRYTCSLGRSSILAITSVCCSFLAAVACCFMSNYKGKKSKKKKQDDVDEEAPAEEPEPEPVPAVVPEEPKEDPDKPPPEEPVTPAEEPETPAADEPGEEPAPAASDEPTPGEEEPAAAGEEEPAASGEEEPASATEEEPVVTEDPAASSTSAPAEDPAASTASAAAEENPAASATGSVTASATDPAASATGSATASAKASATASAVSGSAPVAGSL